ncbi:MAG: mechanosensitive ion channel family protein [Oceanospirillaceae bacterium]|nr:mechanosensitive ion channel family protein [Oceanospirillaceae bacterium]
MYLIACMAIMLACFTPSGWTAETDVTIDADPLRPADTSSPRDTLDSFLTDFSLLVKDYSQSRPSDKIYRTFVRASQTLDFSASPESKSWNVRSERMALLYELLARVPLPPPEQIPGDDEVAESGITQWRIPNTDLAIVQIREGPRAGQFLFSAGTVQSLDRLYRQAKHLPYTPGTASGIYEAMFGAETRVNVPHQILRERLKPVDTSSPRSTFESLLDLVNRAYQLAGEANDALQAQPPRITHQQAIEAETRARELLRRASSTLDLSQVPVALRESASIEASLLLKEILDRMLLPPLDVMPNAQMLAALRAKADEANRSQAEPLRWRVPDTQLEIVEITEGDRTAQFLFSARTVRNLIETYKKIDDLPYRKVQFGGTEMEYMSPEISPGFYESYISASGYLVPEAHFFGRMVSILPASFREMYGRQMVWQWIGLILCALVTLLFVHYLTRASRRLIKGLKAPIRDWLKVLTCALTVSVFLLAEAVIGRSLKFTGNVQAVVTTTITIVLLLLTARLAYLFCRAIGETIASPRRMKGRVSEAALLKIVATVVGFIIAVGIVILGLRALGTDLMPVLAGLGIGGLAIALAAQTTIANFIGGLILLANKPIQVGEFCRYGEDPSSDWLRIGTVEEIGWLATRIRGTDRTVTTIPNAEFSNMHIVNLTRRDQRLMKTTLQLRYETTPDQLRHILIRIRELLLGHPMVIADPARARFVAYGAYSKDIEIYCYLHCTEQNEFLAVQEDLLLRMEDIVTSAGSGYAFPSHTTYIARDSGIDDTGRKKAEADVERLRATGKLPFPEFDEEERDRLEDRLDYPPKGSSGHGVT